MRLVYLYLFANLQDGVDRVPRSEVYKILDEVRVRDKNITKYFDEHRVGISVDKEDDTLRLKLEGRERAQQYLEDVFGPEPANSWYPGCDARSTNNTSKRTTKRSSDKEANSSTLGWVSHPSTKRLAENVLHEDISGLQLRDKALFGLYSIRQTGFEQNVPVVEISEYLFKAFQIQKTWDGNVRRALSQSLKDKHVTHVDGEGYAITPSGSRYIVKLLKLDQPSESSNGGEQK